MGFKDEQLWNKDAKNTVHAHIKNTHTIIDTRLDVEHLDDVACVTLDIWPP